MSHHQALQDLVNVLGRVAQQRQLIQERKIMNTRDFVYWLQGHLELGEVTGITASKVKMIRDHLELAIRAEASAKYLDDEMTRARIAKIYSEAGHHYSSPNSHSEPAGC